MQFYWNLGFNEHVDQVAIIARKEMFAKKVVVATLFELRHIVFFITRVFMWLWMLYLYTLVQVKVVSCHSDLQSQSVMR